MPETATLIGIARTGRDSYRGWDHQGFISELVKPVTGSEKMAVKFRRTNPDISPTMSKNPNYNRI
jgi:hypothetical protein